MGTRTGRLIAGQTLDASCDGLARRAIPVQNADPTAFAQESLGGGSTDTAGTAGDQDSLVMQTAHRVVSSKDSVDVHSVSGSILPESGGQLLPAR